MAQSTGVVDGIEAVQHHTYPEVVPSPAAGAKEAYMYSPGPQQTQPSAAPAPIPPAKTICGLRRTTFILLVLLILVIIIAAVGGGVGGSMAVRAAYDRGRREEASGTTGGDGSESGSRVKTPPTKGVLELDCPGLNDITRRVTVGGTTYQFHSNCGADRPADHGGVDIMRLPAYSYLDCITACAAFNAAEAIEDTTCVAANFNANIATEDGGNCWLKSELGNIRLNTDEATKNLMITGDLTD